MFGYDYEWAVEDDILRYMEWEVEHDDEGRFKTNDDLWDFLEDNEFFEEYVIGALDKTYVDNDPFAKDLIDTYNGNKFAAEALKHYGKDYKEMKKQGKWNEIDYYIRKHLLEKHMASRTPEWKFD